jgi:hypothetical protein
MGLPANPRIFPYRFLCLFLGLFPCMAQAGIVMTGTLGADAQAHFKHPHLGYNVALYAKLDDQTLFGIQSGQGTVVSSQAIPIFGSAIIRLPIGRIVLPVVSGDVGYALDDHNSGFLWRGGGGFDIRNGRHSSLLLLGAYERQASISGWSGRLGILLEF